jgi:flagellar protein FliJ
MDNYNFSMEKVLEWRSTIEKEKMEGFARLQNQIKHEKDKLAELKVDVKDARLNSMREINIYKLQQYNIYIQSIESKIEKKEEKIEKLRQALEEERLELISAQKDRNIMEKLKEKDFSKYKKNMNDLEQKELDEIAVLRHNSQVF